MARTVMSPETEKARGRMAAARGLAVISLVLLVLGVITPIMTVRKFFFLDETVTLASMIVQLFSGGMGMLGMTVALFSVALPATKLAIIAAAASSSLLHGRRAALARFAAAIGKWSMADVFVVALSIVAIKATGMADVFDLPGIYFFGGSVIMSMLASTVLKSGLTPPVGDARPVERIVPKEWYG